MNKGFFYYLGKFLNYLQNKYPVRYNKIQGTGLKSFIFKKLISNYKDFSKNTVTEVKNEKESTEVLEPTVTKE